MNKKYFVEFLGTFTLALVVSMAAFAEPQLMIPVPVLAALVVGLFVYTIGNISGCHLNPAVTLGAFWIEKISRRDAIGYIIAQLAGAGLAIVLGSVLFHASFVAPTAAFMPRLFLAEAMGTFFLTFGIASVVYGRTPPSLSGVVIGGSLLLGVFVATLIGSAGILNPAVALAASSLNFTYLLGPIFGSVLGMQTYRSLM